MNVDASAPVLRRVALEMLDAAASDLTGSAGDLSRLSTLALRASTADRLIRLADRIPAAAVVPAGSRPEWTSALQRASLAGEQEFRAVADQLLADNPGLLAPGEVVDAPEWARLALAPVRARVRAMLERGCVHLQGQLRDAASYVLPTLPTWVAGAHGTEKTQVPSSTEHIGETAVPAKAYAIGFDFSMQLLDAAGPLFDLVYALMDVAVDRAVAKALADALLADAGTGTATDWRGAAAEVEAAGFTATTIAGPASTLPGPGDVPDGVTVLATDPKVLPTLVVYDAGATTVIESTHGLVAAVASSILGYDASSYAYAATAVSAGSAATLAAT